METRPGSLGQGWGVEQGLLVSLPSIHTYAAAAMANTRRKRMKMKVSRLFAVTLFTPKRMVRSSLPCRDRDGDGGRGNSLSWEVYRGQWPPLPESTEAGFSF